MGRQMPWDDIPDSNVFQSGSYHVVGVKLEETTTSTGKLMYSMEVAVAEHPKTAMYTNMHLFENFVIGSDDDPDAGVPGTWVQSFGAKRLKQLLAAAQIAEKADMDKIAASFPQTQLVISLIDFKEPELDRDGNPNQYAGQERNKITGFFKVGQKEPEIAAKKAAPGARPAPAAPVAPVAPVVAPPATPPPSANPAVAPPAPAAPPVAPGVPVVPVAPVAPAVTPAAPVAPAPAAFAVAPAAAPAPAAPATAAPATGVQMLPCNICGGQVPAAEFATHINACLANQGQQAAKA